MNYNFILALLAQFTTMTPEEAQELAKLLGNSIVPVRYEDAKRVVDQAVKDAKEKN